MQARIKSATPSSRATALLLVLSWVLLAPAALVANEGGGPDPEFLRREQRTPLPPAPRISDVEHTLLHYDKTRYCGHPRMIVFQDFGGGEIVVGHYDAPCRYESYADVRHVNYQSRSRAILQRSTDGGKTWPAAEEVPIFDYTQSPEEKRAFLDQDGPREQYDMFRPESMFFFSFTYLVPYPPDGTIPPVPFSLRSPDKGRTWEKVPTLHPHPDDPSRWMHKHGATPVIRMPDDKTLLTVFQMPHADRKVAWGDPALFASTDNGVTWQFQNRPMEDHSGLAHFNYGMLLQRPDGTLHCYALHVYADFKVEGLKNAIAVSVSTDQGRTWSSPEPIVGKGDGCWVAGEDVDLSDPQGGGFQYRSPWTLQLRDGRILVLFARRKMPAGIGGIISSDGGRTWSEEFVIRDDGRWWDLGYPVATELDDGRIFTIYYFPKQDGNREGGTRHIVGTFFRLPDVK